MAILNGSPRKENTAVMVEAFAEGAKAAGHEVEILHVGKMKINGCLACEYCHTKGAWRDFLRRMRKKDRECECVERCESA